MSTKAALAENSGKAVVVEPAGRVTLVDLVDGVDFVDLVDVAFGPLCPPRPLCPPLLLPDACRVGMDWLGS